MSYLPTNTGPEPMAMSTRFWNMYRQWLITGPAEEGVGFGSCINVYIGNVQCSMVPEQTMDREITARVLLFYTTKGSPCSQMVYHNSEFQSS